MYNKHDVDLTTIDTVGTLDTLDTRTQPRGKDEHLILH